jgi:hypothetical protein
MYMTHTLGKVRMEEYQKAFQKKEDL